MDNRDGDRLIVRDSVPIRGQAEEVYARLWDARGWPALTDHVLAVEMLEEGPGHQHFRMRIASDGREVVAETTRRGTPHHSIAYRQSRPPDFFREHEGLWEIEPGDDGVRVTLTHSVVVDDEKLRAFLGVDSDDEAHRRIRAGLSRNGLRTLEAVKRVVEGASR